MIPFFYKNSNKKSLLFLLIYNIKVFERQLLLKTSLFLIKFPPVDDFSTGGNVGDIASVLPL